MNQPPAHKLVLAPDETAYPGTVRATTFPLQLELGGLVSTHNVRQIYCQNNRL